MSKDYQKTLSKIQNELDKYYQNVKSSIENASPSDTISNFVEDSKQYVSQIREDINEIELISPSQKKELSHKLEDYKENVNQLLTSSKFPEDTTKKLKENLKESWDNLGKQVKDLLESNES
jgi:gas vesicle protein